MKSSGDRSHLAHPSSPSITSTRTISLLSMFKRPRVSTWVLMAVFALTMAIYLSVRPPPIPVTPSGDVPISQSRAPATTPPRRTSTPTSASTSTSTETTTRPTTVPSTEAPTTQPTTSAPTHEATKTSEPTAPPTTDVVPTGAPTTTNPQQPAPLPEPT